MIFYKSLGISPHAGQYSETFNCPKLVHRALAKAASVTTLKALSATGTRRIWWQVWRRGKRGFYSRADRDRSDSGTLFLPRLEGSRRHDLQVTNAHFAVAVAETAVQQMTASEGTAPLITAPFVEYSNDSTTCRESFALSVAEAGVEPARELPPTGF